MENIFFRMPEIHFSLRYYDTATMLFCINFRYKIGTISELSAKRIRLFPNPCNSPPTSFPNPKPYRGFSQQTACRG